MENQQIKQSAPLVSILMLTYNRDRFIHEAIASVVAQSYQHWELIVLDDGSTDTTAELVRGFSDERIRYHNDGTNQGLLTRRQESLTLATGTYIAILDSDDVWQSPEKLALQVAYLEAHEGCVLIGTFISLIDGSGQKIGSNSYHATDARIRAHILGRNQFAHSAVVMRRSAVAQTAGYHDFPISEDLNLFLQLGTVGTLANIALELTAYRLHGPSASSKKKALVAQILKIIKRHQFHYPGFFSAYVKYSLYYLFVSVRELLGKK